VTGDGTVSAYDASRVARFAVGLEDHFAVAQSIGSDWKFLRCDAYAYPGDPGCGDPVYQFSPMSQSESGKNFYAVLYGEVTGNWRPAGGFAAAGGKSSPAEEAAMAADQLLAAQFQKTAPRQVERSAGSPPAELSLSGWRTPLGVGQKRQVTINLRHADGILGLDLSLTYDPSRIAIVGVQSAGIGSQCGVEHADQGGTHRIAAYGVLPLSGSGSVLTVTVEALKDVGRQAPLNIGGGVANEGLIPLQVQGWVEPPLPRQPATPVPTGDAEVAGRTAQ
jgi:hypothetical protein